MSRRPQDPWSRDRIGFCSSLGAVGRAQQKGTRSYAPSGYLAPKLGRTNLKVRCEATAYSLVLENTTATGLRFMQGGQTYEVSAEQEVILSCGVIGSPQLLELSGIGEPKVLEAASVDCLVENSGVDANFQDHVSSAMAYEMMPSNDFLDSIHKLEMLQEHQKMYMET